MGFLSILLKAKSFIISPVGKIVSLAAVSILAVGIGINKIKAHFEYKKEVARQAQILEDKQEVKVNQNIILIRELKADEKKEVKTTEEEDSLVDKYFQDVFNVFSPK